MPGCIVEEEGPAFLAAVVESPEKLTKGITVEAPAFQEHGVQNPILETAAAADGDVLVVPVPMVPLGGVPAWCPLELSSTFAVEKALVYVD